MRQELEVSAATERHNTAVRQKLRQAIIALDPTDFELFVVRVLTELGFEVETEHTGRTIDGGVDAEAVLSLEGLTSVFTKIQAKRWSSSVPGRVVRELRGALRVDERGLIVTTAEFTSEAVREAAAEGKTKIGLLGGDALVRLCAERGIGVNRRQLTLLELAWRASSRIGPYKLSPNGCCQIPAGDAEIAMRGGSLKASPMPGCLLSGPQADRIGPQVPP
jgi:restriction endonuclease Mrr